MKSNVAYARFLRAVAVALNQLAADLTEDSPETPVEDASLSPESLVTGTRQRAIVALPGLRETDGLKTAEVAQALGQYDLPNVHLALRALERRGLVELVPNRSPQRWRLVERFRASDDGVATVAGEQ